MSLADKLKERLFKEHLYLAAIFFLSGVFSVVVRKIYSVNKIIDTITNIVGTVTWAGLITVIISFLLVKNRGWKYLLPGIAVAFCWGIEFLQLTQIPAAISRSLPPARLIFGSTYSSADLPWYAMGVLLSWIVLGGFKRQA